MGLFNKKENVQQPKKKFTIWGILQTVAILGLFADVAILILGLRGVFRFNSSFVLLLLIILIVSVAMLLSMPWIKRLEKNKDKIVSIIFLSILIVFAILWIVATVMVVNLFKQIEDITISKVYGKLNFIKFTLIATMQFAVANLIASTILKYRKKLIVLQAIMYASNLYVDVWFTILFTGLKITNDGLSFNINPFLFNGVVITILSIAICYTLILNAIVKRTQRRKYGYSMFDLDADDEKSEGHQVQPAKAEASAEEKLVKLKKMLDQNLITQEEYDQKKQDILNKM